MSIGGVDCWPVVGWLPGEDLSCQLRARCPCGDMSLRTFPMSPRVDVNSSLRGGAVPISVCTNSCCVQQQIETPGADEVRIKAAESHKDQDHAADIETLFPAKPEASSPCNPKPSWSMRRDPPRRL